MSSGHEVQDLKVGHLNGWKEHHGYLTCDALTFRDLKPTEGKPQTQRTKLKKNLVPHLSGGNE